MTILRGTVAWLAEYQRKQSELRARPRAPPKRLKLTRPAPKETDVLTVVRQALAFDKRVAWVGRFNSGLMWQETAGKRRPVRFHDVPGLSDLIGQMTDGRLLALEIKRPGWTKPTDERERQQAAFIELVLRHGGVAGFVRSVEDVKKLIDASRGAREV